MAWYLHNALLNPKEFAYISVYYLNYTKNSKNSDLSDQYVHAGRMHNKVLPSV